MTCKHQVAIAASIKTDDSQDVVQSKKPAQKTELQGTATVQLTAATTED